MRRKHSGWLKKYLSDHINNDPRPAITDFTRCNSICRIQGLRKLPAKTLIILNCYHVDTPWWLPADSNPIFKSTKTAFLRNIYPEGVDATLLRILGWIKCFTLRKYRARKIANLRPAHGQSTWHNRKSAKHCHHFLHNMCKSLVNDIYKLRTNKVMHYSKQLAMKLMSKTKKKKKKKYTKFKKFGERTMSLKRKKGLWS